MYQVSLIQDNYDILRDKYKPEKIKVLFVGESRPAGGTFFYSENSILYYNTETAFINAGIPFSLEKFQELGCWLYDVCNEPVNNGLTRKERREIIRQGLPALNSLIAELQPQAIIVVKKREMREEIFEKLEAPNNTELFNLPFPACGHQVEYVQGLTAILKRVFL